MRFFPIDRLEAAAQQAEDAWRRGDFLSAFQQYAKAVSERLANSAYGIDPTMRLEAADFVVFGGVVWVVARGHRAKRRDEVESPLPD